MDRILEKENIFLSFNKITNKLLSIFFFSKFFFIEQHIGEFFYGIFFLSYFGRVGRRDDQVMGKFSFTVWIIFPCTEDLKQLSSKDYTT